MEIIKVKNLKKHFILKSGFLESLITSKEKDIIKAVDGIDFTIETGKIIGLGGESGCGKTTTGFLLTNLYKPTEGERYYNGREYEKWEENQRKFRQKVQMIFQDPYESLNPRFTAYDEIVEPLKALKIDSQKERETKVGEMLELVGLEPSKFKNKYPHQLSGGERQRVGIASALCPNPSFVVADEPVSMLDVSVRAGVLDLLSRLSREVNFTCLYISHDLSVMANISQKIMIMYLGRIVEKGPTSELIENPIHPYTKALISAVPVPDPFSERVSPEIKGGISEATNLPKGCHFAPRCLEAKTVCQKQRPHLQEVEEGHWVSCHFVNSR